MTPDTEAAASGVPLRKKPTISFLLATWFGAGYLPKAPGTWGSLAGVIVTFIIQAAVGWKLPAGCCLLLAVVGVWSSSRVAAYTGKKDPQFVVIDEVSGQMLTLVLGAPVFSVSSSIPVHTPWGNFGLSELWLVLVAAFLLFRLFDIWKPWPIRRLERLPGGWGIMADDWLAGIYAAIVLRLALHFHVL